ncbi:MAG: bifunctional UDP-N-acetylglucosamine diphosphorylase/glucosamine-1-phosphate N-acetyltransferase GlmU [Clostridia bacterium]|nr:bifunctional UDP-N-acetylglucosamine diphosphorylase/glucosamine-1-phosphate N-acetyltransferase GlmU [Clostridia bacterium]
MKVKGIILAAGKGTRMKSDIPKVLHRAAGRTMAEWAVNSALSVDEKPTVVVGHSKEEVMQILEGKADFVFQLEQKGTGHAVMMAKENIKGSDYTVITYGDMILLRKESIEGLVDLTINENLDAAVLTAFADDPTGLGRIINNSEGYVEKIVEHRDANEEQLKINEINTGVFCFKSDALLDALGKIGCDNSQGEYYLTDAVEIINKSGGRIKSAHCDALEALGTNDRAQLALSAKELRRRINNEHMINGVTLIDPDNTYIDADVKIGNDTIIYPGCVIEGKTEIGSGCVIYGATNIKDSKIAENVTIKASNILHSSVGSGTNVGPNAYLRPKSKIGKNCKIGDFVEIKNSDIGDDTKISHLTYVGDADIGKDVNLGCGVVVVNYDGKNKNRTVVEDNAFVGCNTNLVSPVRVGKGAYTAAGSTITEDVPEGALAIARSRQINKEDWKKK